ncbi:hypothetical protein DFJ74DRAFT_772971 [Hyaloraphidium curvatum]|nr:hypothetical protein DFJ74DRAFT_772971 [Hyaloraphidium curvatum]
MNRNAAFFEPQPSVPSDPETSDAEESGASDGERVLFAAEPANPPRGGDAPAASAAANADGNNGVHSRLALYGGPSHEGSDDEFAEEPETSLLHAAPPRQRGPSPRPAGPQPPPWAVTNAPPRTHSRVPSAEPPPRPTPPPKRPQQASHTAAEPPPPSPSTSEPYYGETAGGSGTMYPSSSSGGSSGRSLLSNISSAAKQGFKIAKVKGAEIGQAAKEWSQMAAEKTQEQWDKQREKRTGSYDDSDVDPRGGAPQAPYSSPATTGRSQSWLSRLSSPQHHTVFGQPLAQAVKHTFLASPAPPHLPAVVVRCLQVLDREDVMKDNVGLYRISASRKELDRLRALVDTSPKGDIDFGWWEDEDPGPVYWDEEVASGGAPARVDGRQREDPNAVAGLFKMFLREAPDANIPGDVAQRLDAVDLASPSATTEVRSILMPGLSSNQALLCLLSSLFMHLNRMASHADENKMPAGNLAIVFAPTVGNGASVSVVELLIDRAADIFPRTSAYGQAKLASVPRPSKPSPARTPARLPSVREPGPKPQLPPRKARTDPTPVEPPPAASRSMDEPPPAKEAPLARRSTDLRPAPPVQLQPPAKPPKPSKSQPVQPPAPSSNPFTAAADRMVGAVKSTIRPRAAAAQVAPAALDNPFSTVRLSRDELAVAMAAVSLAEDPVPEKRPATPAKDDVNPFATVKLTPAQLAVAMAGIDVPEEENAPVAPQRERPRIPTKPDLSRKGPPTPPKDGLPKEWLELT